jgi:23S rRNA pseudoU1915 N3-methylase RlmH
MAELTNEQKLAEAQAAYHALLTGQQIVTINYEGRSVQYRNFASDLEQLRAYIQQLTGLIDPCKVRRPFRVIW